MKTSIRNLFLLPVLVVSLSSIPAERVTAQTFTTLHSFSADAALANNDGRYPSAVILSDTILYGTAFAGGTLTWGTVFKLNADGTGFRTLRSFSGGSDGSALSGRLVLSGNVLYGTAQQAGSSGDGTAFKLNTDGTGAIILHR